MDDHDQCHSEIEYPSDNTAAIFRGSHKKSHTTPAWSAKNKPNPNPASILTATTVKRSANVENASYLLLRYPIVLPP
jgi:hypothetical protein